MCINVCAGCDCLYATFIFLIFPPKLFLNIHILIFSFYFLKPWMIFSNIQFLSKLQVIFHSFVLLDLEFTAAFISRLQKFSKFP